MLKELLRTQPGNRRPAGIFTLILINIILIFALVHLQTSSSAAPIPQSPAVAVADQRDSPLTISVEGYDLSDPSSPKITYKVQNISDKAIRAYSIVEEIIKGGGRSSGAKIINLGKGHNFLEPQQVRAESCDVSSRTDPVTSVTLSVDYVEFGDGTAWGKDTRRAAEYLAGQREGRRAAVKKIEELREQQGVGGVAELLRKKDAEVAAPPAGRASEWDYGFRVGHNATLYELRKAHVKGGLQALGSELRKQLEDVDGRP